MFEVKLLNLQNDQVFFKYFDSEYLFEKFMRKLKYSKKLKLIAYFKY